MAEYDAPGCVFVDIDGTIAKHQTTEEAVARPLELLPGTAEIWADWIRRGFKVVVTTGRRESLRAVTEEGLRLAGLQYDLLLMGCGTGPRILYNDLKPGDRREMAVGVNLERDGGLVPLGDVLGREVSPAGR